MGRGAGDDLQFSKLLEMAESIEDTTAVLPLVNLPAFLHAGIIHQRHVVEVGRTARAFDFLLRQFREGDQVMQVAFLQQLQPVRLLHIRS